MHGPPLSPSEIAAKFARGVERLEGLGVSGDRAVEAVAAEHGVAPDRLAQLLEVHAVGNREKTTVMA